MSYQPFCRALFFLVLCFCKCLLLTDHSHQLCILNSQEWRVRDTEKSKSIVVHFVFHLLFFLLMFSVTYPRLLLAILLLVFIWNKGRLFPSFFSSPHPTLGFVFYPDHEKQMHTQKRLTQNFSRVVFMKELRGNKTPLSLISSSNYWRANSGKGIQTH